jgi:hypothetical protein
VRHRHDVEIVHPGPSSLGWAFSKLHGGSTSYPHDIKHNIRLLREGGGKEGRVCVWPCQGRIPHSQRAQVVSPEVRVCVLIESGAPQIRSGPLGPGHRIGRALAWAGRPAGPMGLRRLLAGATAALVALALSAPGYAFVLGPRGGLGVGGMRQRGTSLGVGGMEPSDGIPGREGLPPPPVVDVERDREVLKALTERMYWALNERQSKTFQELWLNDPAVSFTAGGDDGVRG